MGSIFHALDPRGRQVSTANLEACAPCLRLSDNSHQLVIRDSYRNFVTSALDLVWSRQHINFKNYSELFFFEDSANFPELVESQTPVIFVTYHFGNFEVASCYMAFAGPGYVVVQQETKNPGLEEILSDLRTVGRNRPITRKGAMLRLLRTLKSGGSIGLLADLTVPPGKMSTLAEIFGLKICVTRLHAELARRTGAPIVPIVARPRPDRTYLIETRPPIYVGPEDDPDVAVQACITHLEDWIRQEPHLWLWSYKHFRYFEPGREERYPFYANRKTGFSKMVRAREKMAEEEETRS